MACVTTPTSTLFSTTITTSFSTSTSLETIAHTGDPTVTVTSTTACASSTTLTLSESLATTCASTTTSTFTTTLPGTVDTTISTHLVPIPQTGTSSFPTETLYGTSCPTDPPTTSDPPKPPSTTDTPPPQTSVTTSTSTTAIEFPNGSTSISTVFITVPFTPPPESSTSTSTTPPPPSLNDDGGGGSPGHGAQTAKIAGAVVGGLVGVALLAVLAFWLWKRSRRWDDIFDESDDEGGDHNDRPGWKAVGAPVRLRERNRPPKKPRVDLDPEPYHYGLVGSAAAMSAPSAETTTSSPPIIPLGLFGRPSTHTRLPSSPGESMSFPAGTGVNGTPLHPNGFVDPFAAAAPPPRLSQTPSPRPMSARASPRQSTGSGNTFETTAAAAAARRVSAGASTMPLPGAIQVPGPSTRPGKPSPRPQSSSGPVIVHTDGGPASPDGSPALSPRLEAEPPAYRD
ncbi:hypothetical protein EXIGLDRAFT_733789 [Exidia glandulosa HHB12029]|uniref:Mid2 domain-containing protein n=1 Tax=Exidia glandulosa HHB12029 TaxID=1314781 RepID=A0A165KEV3_EXIGL|nr:hypothetical protein EXIGLDRAFT_733789 [Exidia glandulosa HHB12029]